MPKKIFPSISEIDRFFWASRQKNSGGVFNFVFYWCIGTFWGWIFVNKIMVPVSFCYIERMFFRFSEEYFPSGLLKLHSTCSKDLFEEKLFFPKRVRFLISFRISSDKMFNHMANFFCRVFQNCFLTVSR